MVDTAQGNGSLTQMATEIREQPAALAATSKELRPRHEEMRRFAADCERVVLFGRGSSDSAATYGRYLLEVLVGMPAAMGAPSVMTLYGARQSLVGTLAVFCSQSGETEELVECAELMRQYGARVMAITNDGASPLAAASQLLWPTEAGAEQAIPATKSHTTCLLALAELCVALMPASHQRLRHVVQSLNRVPEESQASISQADSAQSIAARLSSRSAWCLSGRGYTYATALEVALKIEETSAIPCVAMSQADLQHGPVAVLTAGRPLLIAAASSGPTMPGLSALARNARQRGSEVVLLGGDGVIVGNADENLRGSDLAEEVQPIPLVVLGQLLAEALSRSRGLDPDRPAGLSKVTQTL
jgi:glucosamine--fructose-6-phosphate aminotransferase (isomerizing)